jgi:hypothetical protein
MKRSPQALALGLAALIAACGSDSPTAVRIGTIRIEYLAAETTGGADPACPHHYAPENLFVNTSWGARGRLAPVGENRYGFEFAAPEPGEHWLYLTDIALCDQWPSAPRPTRGIFVNGTELQRQTTANGGTAMLFTLAASGTVAP